MNKGVYVAVKVLEQYNNLIIDYIQKNNIPHKTNSQEDFKHITIIYSTVYAKITPEKYVLHIVYPVKFDIFKTQNNTNALVLLLDAPSIIKRHNQLMKKHSLVYDYIEYKPHITFSYDVGNLKLEQLPNFKHNLVVGNEYVEDLNLNWQNS